MGPQGEYERKKKNIRTILNPLMATRDKDSPEGATPMESEEVKFVIEELMKTLNTATGSKSSDGGTDGGPSMQDVDDSFAKLLSDIKSSSTLSGCSQKRVLTAETALTMMMMSRKETQTL